MPTLTAANLTEKPRPTCRNHGKYAEKNQQILIEREEKRSIDLTLSLSLSLESNMRVDVG